MSERTQEMYVRAVRRLAEHYINKTSLAVIVWRKHKECREYAERIKVRMDVKRAEAPNLKRFPTIQLMKTKKQMTTIIGITDAYR